MKKNERSVLVGWGRLLGAAVGLSLVVGLVLVAFSWPSVRSAPRDVPVAVVGSASAADQVDHRLQTQQPGAFDLQPYDDQQAAEQAIRDREVYGALIVRPGSPPAVLTASAASPVIAQALSQMGQQMADPAATSHVRDVVPASPEDPRGAGLSTSVLPLIIGGVLSTVLLDRLASNPLRRALAVVVFAGAAGLVVGLVLHSWLAVVDGGYWTTSAISALGIGAIGLTLTGLHAMLGAPGMGLGAAVMMLLGNPLSGMSSAPEMLPSGWSTVGQLLPPGAFGTLLRSASSFDGAGGGGALLVLLAWCVLGLLLCSAAHARRATPAAEQEERVLAAV